MRGYISVAVSAIPSSPTLFAAIRCSSIARMGLRSNRTRSDGHRSALQRSAANSTDVANSRFVMTGSQVRVLFAAPALLQFLVGLEGTGAYSSAIGRRKRSKCCADDWQRLHDGYEYNAPLLLPVEQEVGGSSPPNCTSKNNCLDQNCQLAISPQSMSQQMRAS